MNCEHGTVVWRLRASVHRPGAFKSKLTITKEITVVAGPGEDDTDDTENIIVERQWDDQMQYHIVVSGRTFILGGSLPLTVTFIPWTKMKVMRVSVVIEGVYITVSSSQTLSHKHCQRKLITSRNSSELRGQTPLFVFLYSQSKEQRTHQFFHYSLTILSHSTTRRCSSSPVRTTIYPTWRPRSWGRDLGHSTKNCRSLRIMSSFTFQTAIGAAT